ncbi:MAG: synthase [Frankiales bacterium]|nr:synthase [Frankiales bacterium]
MSEQAATNAGTTRPAGAGVDDEEFSDEVAQNTANDLKAEDVFEREQDGASTETEAAKASGDELNG